MCRIWLLVFFLSACGRDSAFIPDPTSADQVKGADAALRTFNAEAFKKGEMLWRVAAAEGYIVQVKDETHLFDAFIEHFETNKKSRDYGKATIITGKRAIMERGNKFMTLTGDVKVDAPHGRKLRTEELYWDEEKNKLYSNVSVTIIEANGDVLTGRKGIETDRTLSRTVFKSAVGGGTTK